MQGATFVGFASHLHRVTVLLEINSLLWTWETSLKHLNPDEEHLSLLFYRQSRPYDRLQYSFSLRWADKGVRISPFDIKLN